MTYRAASNVSRNVQAVIDDDNHVLYVAAIDNDLCLKVNIYTEVNTGRVYIPPQNIRCVLPNGAILICDGFMHPGVLYRINAVDQSNHFWVEVRCFND